MQDRINDFGKRFEFNEAVSNVFDDMLSRSIPGYETMRDLVYRLGVYFVKKGETIIDIGSSTGEGYRQFADSGYNVISCEVSEPMLEIQRKRFSHYENVDIRKVDITEGFPEERASLVTSIFTLQFIPVEERRRVVRRIYESLEPGGCLIAAEKVICEDTLLDSIFVDEYYQTKIQNGYSREQILRKKAALSGVMVPFTVKDDTAMLEQAGFTVSQFWQSLNFVGFICLKNR